MRSSEPLRPLAVVGPTASGKSSLALGLAERVSSVELVSVDSMQVYRGMDVGTAKPTPGEQAAVPHHMIDVLDPHEECSVAWFAEQARAVSRDLATRGRTKVLVGGTGLYHRAVVDDLDIPGQFPEVAAELESEPDPAVLHRRLTVLDPIAAGRIDPGNRRRLLRALEVTIGSGRPFSSSGAGLETYPATDVVFVGLDVDRGTLTERIERRLDRQMEEGFLDEVARLDARPDGWSRTAAQALGYRELLDVVHGCADLSTRLEEIRLRTRRFAVRQVRWYLRDPRIRWFEATSPELRDDVLEYWGSAK